MAVFGKGDPQAMIDPVEIEEAMREAIPEELYRGKRVLVLTPDGTRTCPLPLMVEITRKIISGQCSRLTFMVALGTHPPLGLQGILQLYGIKETSRWEKCRLLDHRWDVPGTLERIGHLAEKEVEELSGGLLKEEVPIEVNRELLEHDLVVVIGPVFPHEVVGFSGGAKYLFPGVSGGEFLHFFHWLGAVLTCKMIIGTKDTPVRRMIHRAARMVPLPVKCVSVVVRKDGKVAGVFAGDLEEAWSHAADLSSLLHIIKKDKTYDLVLGEVPTRYEELWTAGKVMYKLEQVVSKGGTLIIYGPHVKEVSRTWGHYIEAIGYHVRDYFLAQMGRFKGVPRGVLAHLTHVKGTGSYVNGLETPDVNVKLATGIPEDVCRRINLGYLDPKGITLEEYEEREDEGILLVREAGEILYKYAREG